MNTAVKSVPTEAELELRKRRSVMFKELRDLIRLKSRDQILLRQSIKEKSRIHDHESAGSCMSQKWQNRREITAALVLYAELRGQKSSHKMDWMSEMIHGNLIKKLGSFTTEELKVLNG
jgi:hypothetical protein